MRDIPTAAGNGKHPDFLCQGPPPPPPKIRVCHAASGGDWLKSGHFHICILGSAIWLPFNGHQIRHEVKTSPQSNIYCLWITIGYNLLEFHPTPLCKENRNDCHYKSQSNQHLRTCLYVACYNFQRNSGTGQNQGDLNNHAILFCTWQNPTIYLTLVYLSQIHSSLSFSQKKKKSLF